jgi:hypothetical protein
VDHCDEVWIAVAYCLQDGNGIGHGRFAVVQSKISLEKPALDVCVHAASYLRSLACAKTQGGGARRVCGVNVVGDSEGDVRTFPGVLALLAFCLDGILMR